MFCWICPKSCLAGQSGLNTEFKDELSRQLFIPAALQRIDKSDLSEEEMDTPPRGIYSFSVRRNLKFHFRCNNFSNGGLSKSPWGADQTLTNPTK